MKKKIGITLVIIFLLISCYCSTINATVVKENPNSKNNIKDIGLNSFNTATFYPPYSSHGGNDNTIGIARAAHNSNNEWGDLRVFVESVCAGKAEAKAYNTLDFYVGSKKNLHVKAEFIGIHGRNSLSLSAGGANSFIYKIDNKGYNEVEIDGLLDWDILLSKYIQLAAKLSIGINFAAEILFFIMHSVAAGYLTTYINTLEDEGEKLFLEFDLPVDPGEHSIKLGVQSYTLALPVYPESHAYGTIAGYMPKITIEGLEAPGKPSVDINVDKDYGVLVFGDLEVDAMASVLSNDNKIKKVEYYLNNKRMGVYDTKHSKWTFNQEFIGWADIKVKAYDFYGNIDTDTEDVFLFNPFGSSVKLSSINGNIDSTAKQMRTFTATVPVEKSELDKAEAQGIDVTFTYTFDFGDGIKKTVEKIKETTCAIDHTYQKNGRYDAEVKITANINVDGKHFSISQIADITEHEGQGKITFQSILNNIIFKLKDNFPILKLLCNSKSF